MRGQDVDKARLCMRHDAAAHLLAEALQQRFPDAQFVHRHANEEGFICEVALEHALALEDLAALEQHMAAMVARNWPCQRVYWSQQRVLAYMRRQGQHEQCVWLEQASREDAPRPIYMASSPQLCGSWSGADWPDDLAVYQHGNFVEVCAGPHVESVGEIGVCRLLRVESVRESAGLQRISGRVDG